MNRSPWRTGVAKRVPRSLIGALAPESISHFGKHYGHNFQTWWQKGVKTPWFLEFLVSPALFPLKKQPNGRIIWHAWLEYHLLEEDYDHLHFYRATNADIKGQWTGKSGLCWIYIYIAKICEDHTSSQFRLWQYPCKPEAKPTFYLACIRVCSNRVYVWMAGYLHLIPSCPNSFPWWNQIVSFLSVRSSTQTAISVA